MEIVSLAAVEQVNQGIEPREAADAAPVLILGYLVKTVTEIALFPLRATDGSPLP